MNSVDGKGVDTYPCLCYNDNVIIVKGKSGVKIQDDTMKHEIVSAMKKIEEKKEKWLAAIREDQIGVFTHVLNTDENDIVKAYSIQAFPTKILLSPTGEILGRWEGEASELDQMLEKIFLK